jgi:small-conductance mechanosensitive channel
LQEVIASVAGWIALSFGQFYTVGDRVQLGGIKGDVIDIGVLRTTLMEIGEWVNGDQYNGRIVRVANSFVFKESVYNYSADFPFVWDEITVPVKYGSDHILARKIIKEAANETVSEYTVFAQQTWQKMLRKYAFEEASVEPMVMLIANDNWMEFTLRYVVDFKKRRGTKDLLFTRILDGVAASNGRVSMASATFQLVEAPTLDVRLHHTQ